MRNLLFKLFGETKMFYWIFGLVVVINVIFWGAVLFIAGHFIIKLW